MVLIAQTAGIVLGILSAALLLFFLLPIRYPILNHSDLAEPEYLWRMYYAHKYLFPIKRAIRGSGREAYFRELSFDFGPAKTGEREEITIAAVGDLMCRPDLRAPHPALWEELGPELFSADLSIGNLEFAVNPRRQIRKIIRYSVTHEEALPLVGDPRFGRFSVLSLGNNHLNDSLSGGIVSTLDFLDAQGLQHVGANRTPLEQDAFPILDVKGVRVAILSYAFTTNGIPLESGFGHGVNVVKFNALNDANYDPSLVLRHIDVARRRGADYIISCNHWGVEFEYYPPERIIERGHALLDAGIDLIIGHHPHILNPVDRYRTRDGRDGVIFCSLANTTTFALRGREKKLGVMARIVLTAGTDASGRRTLRPARVEQIPFVYSRNRVNGAWTHRLLRVMENCRALDEGRAPAHLSAKDVRRLRFAKREFDRYFRQRGISVS